MKTFASPPSLLFLSIVVLSSAFGYACGRVASIQFDASEYTMHEEIADLPPVPTIQITGIENGNLIGTMRGDGRLFVDDAYVVPANDGSFTVSSDVLLKNILRIQVPEGMRYVASRNGKKYYPVDSSQGSNLSPKYRVYFATEEQAKQAGYRP